MTKSFSAVGQAMLRFLSAKSLDRKHSYEYNFTMQLSSLYLEKVFATCRDIHNLLEFLFVRLQLEYVELLEC